MTVRGGFHGKLLEVDLSRGRTRAVPLPPENVLRQWGGGTGLGLYLLAQEITPTMEPTDPECPFFVMTGPLTGSLAPMSSNWTIINLRSCPSYHPGVSQSHGHWGARLKHAGWDGIVVRGASPEPVYLWIDNDHVEIRDARPYWGQTTFETVRKIQVDNGDLTSLAVACIGPGGESLLPGASVRDGVWGATMGEAGQAWGSKKLKAIAVRGSGRVPLADVGAMQAACDRWMQVLYGHEFAPQEFWKGGGVFRPQYNGQVPFKNFSEPGRQFEWSERMRVDCPQWKVRPLGSWNCERNCHSEVTVTTGPMAGARVSGFFGEVIQEMGPNMGIIDPGVAAALTGVVDGLGLAAAGVPRTIAMLMEAYDKERISRDQVGGIDLSWGNYEGVVEMLEKAVQRDGVGAVLAKPIKEVAREFGIEDLAMQMKGFGFNDHDLRWHPAALFEILLISGAGPTWQGAIRYYERPEYASGGEPDQGLKYLPWDDPEALKAVPRYSYEGQKKKLWEDTIGVCWTALRAYRGAWDEAIACLSAAVGWEGYSREESLLVGERVINLQRLISLFKGYRPEYDWDISERMLTVPDDWPTTPAGKNWPKGKPLSIKPLLGQWRDEYYRFLDWDPATGLPHPKALQKVGLADFKVGKEPSAERGSPRPPGRP